MASITKAEWAECIEYANIRGPIGPHRHDTLTAMLAMYIAKPYMGGDQRLADYMPPWIPPAPEDDTDD